VFDHIGITQKDLWNKPIFVCVKYSLRGNQRVNQTQGEDLELSCMDLGPRVGVCTKYGKYR
jgi:hypothetical protein